ncbi:MAG: glycoside hydrolase family 92 protein [Prevotella sp.]|jgi:putative alpha-1,2-mannosidase|uniref:GH92 family glycosyl hydrolase n=1 Tax=uncultured Prevotella sp. TaxID=159272 RepID=UPI001CAB0290|nr:GH92 family glycosyl hydrolase [uncultured Prevotella sp.]MBF1626792.1 glycoside hydrolase family 92 protein [Prevotella sp.]MBF1644803.1 glycoside hydrolase family 92 protein [Prevotella sp.]
MKKIFLTAAVALATIFSVSAQDYTQYVNPFIGTGGHGHVFLGANVPFGNIQAGPTQKKQGWDWCSGYHYSDSTVIGFGQMHLSGTGIGDLGDVSLLPMTNPSQREVKFSHRAEYVRPGYYSVMLASGIRVELTATQRVAFHRYSFPADATKGYIALNLAQGIGWDKMTSCKFKQESDKTVTGFRMSEGWAKDQRVYFVAEFSEPVKLEENERDTIGIFSVASTNQPLLVKVGISAVSVENARENLQQELPGWNFASVVAKANADWNRELSKIAIKTQDERAKRIFYTALYHTMIAPSVFSDVNGEYRGADGKTHKGDFTDYTTFSLWDTYRAAFPLMTLIQPEMQRDLAETMLHIFKQQGKLPVWHLMGNETDCMVGNPGIPVLVDIALKGFNVDKKAVFEAVKASAMRDERGMGLLKKYGYIPCDLDPEKETVAKGLEYALADACIAKLAKQLGKIEDYKYFYKRSQSYRDFYFDKQTKFMRGVTSDHKFREPFDPFSTVHRQDDYTEGNAWQYVWLVPHDVHGLVAAFGGEKPFVSKLDSLFIVNGDMGADASPDITGLIGQYAHGNEPSHHILYMYNYVGQPWKGAEKIRYVLANLYHDDFDGLSGNEDVGQMSAWYILSSVGFYQVDPAGGRYVFGSPLFDEATLNVGNGKTFRVVAHNNSSENKYIQSAKLNGKPYTRSYIDFKDIVRGGTLEFVMGNKPSQFGVKPSDRP